MNEVEEATPTPVTLTELRANLRYTIDRVLYFNMRFVVLRDGMPVAVLLGVESYRELMRMTTPRASPMADQP